MLSLPKSLQSAQAPISYYKYAFLGYSNSHKGFKCLSPTGRLYISKHVEFNENDFPFTSGFINKRQVPVEEVHPGVFFRPLLSALPEQYSFTTDDSNLISSSLTSKDTFVNESESNSNHAVRIEEMEEDASHSNIQINIGLVLDLSTFIQSIPTISAPTEQRHLDKA